MKRITSIFSVLICMSWTLEAHNYVESSVLASGNIVKIQVPSSGVYCFSYEQLEALGLNPPYVRVLGYGGNLIDQDFRQVREDDVPSVPFYMHKGTDEVFSSGDYILFYALGPVGWAWNGSLYERTRNYYANYGCYFLSDNAGEQRLISMTDTLESTDPVDVYTYTEYKLHEQEKINLIDLSGIAGGGREWYGESLTANSSVTVPFDFSNVVIGQNLRCRVKAAASASELTQMSAKVASGTQRCMFSPIGDHIQASTGNIDFMTPATANSLPVELTYSATAGTSYKGYINYIEMHVPCSLKLEGNYMVIRNTDYVGSAQLSRYHLLGADASTQIWNITKPTQAYLSNTTWQGDTLCWLGSNLTPQVFLAVRTNGSFSTPANRGKILNQNIHHSIRGAQHIIVAPDYLRAPAEQLKQAHELYYPSERWQVVSDEEVYNEFSSGTPDASAIRWMMKYLWDNFGDSDQAPRSLLLFGDGTYDNRQILSTSGTPVLLTYQAHNSTSEPQAYATDDYFGWLLDNAGINGNTWNDAIAKMQISVGRLPVTTYEQAEQVVSKIILYLSNTSFSNWKQQLCFLADDGDKDNPGVHTRSVEMATTEVSKVAPEYIINKIYLDAYEQETTASGEQYPLAQSTYNNLLKSGVLLMDFAGHGSPNNICSEMFLTRKQVESMVNLNLGLWALATCNFAHFDQRDLSTAEAAVLNPNGGAIGVVASDRTAYVNGNELLNMLYCTYLFTRDSMGRYPYTMGEALRLAKNAMTSSRSNSLGYVLLGDPAVKLNYAEPYQLLITQIPDTLHALDLVTINGYVANENKDTVLFNGEITITVFDKEQTMVTRDNDQPDTKLKHYEYYKDYPYKLFVGQAIVEDGKFTIQFRMPKDLRYKIDYARLTLYASGEDANGHAEALGYSQAFKIGGSSPIIIDDNEGPEMQIYLNTPFFKEGDEVQSTPHFYANLRDQNGINTAGSGIGHDLLLTVDNDAKQAYVLNSYYSSVSGSYQQGTVSYPMSSMADGYHTLSFRAWDMPGNVTIKTLGFNVNKDIETSLKELIVYPNPIARNGELSMLLSHDRPDDLMSISLTIYDISGHTMWSTSRRLYGVDAQSYISFNLSEANLKAGAYIYQFRLQTTTQTSSPYAGKIVVY